MSNAIELLREDHRRVKDLFDHFEATESGDKKQIVDTTLRELAVHTAIEEEIFYPAARRALENIDGDQSDTIDEAWEEHHVVKLLAAELKKMRASDDRYDAKFTVLAEAVKHHIEEEEGELFPKLEGHIENEELGEKIMTRKQSLLRTDSKSNTRSGNAGTRSARNRGKAKPRMRKRRRASGNRR